MMNCNIKAVQPKDIKVQPKDTKVQPKESQSGMHPKRAEGSSQLSGDNQKATDATDATEHATEKMNIRLHPNGQRFKNLNGNATNATEYFLKVYKGIEIVKKMRIRVNIHAYKILRKRRLHRLHQLHG